MTTFTLTVDPDEMDDLVAQQLRECYVSLASAPPVDWAERIPTMEAILVVLEHYMAHSEYEAWYETIKEL